MKLRLRVLSILELEQAQYDGFPRVISLHQANYPEESEQAVLEIKDEDGVWDMVEVTYS